MTLNNLQQIITYVMTRNRYFLRTKREVLFLPTVDKKTGEGLGIEAIKPEGRPLIPSIILSMHKIKDSVEGRWMHTQKGTKMVWVEE